MGLYHSIRELQCIQYFKSVFLEILNALIRLVFVNPVTNDATFQSSTAEVAASGSPGASSSEPVTEADSNTETVEATTSRYPKRVTKPPERYM